MLLTFSRTYLLVSAIFIASREHVTVAQSSDRPTSTTNDLSTSGDSTMNNNQIATSITTSVTSQPGDESNLPTVIFQTLVVGGASGVIITVAIGSAIAACYYIYKKR